ncbi:unnamed protein product [Ilex paraguariensis]|uniref:X8 domain-containing protein n=1 Tax=Ilex paraguariensis TaxID=185542 RepID=A0ABC8TF74_9AQUA
MQSKKWCVSKLAVPHDAMQKFIDDNCKKLDCTALKPGGGCYKPDNLYNHGSYVLNQYYRAYGVCPSDIGTLAITNPTSGSWL